MKKLLLVLIVVVTVSIGSQAYAGWNVSFSYSEGRRGYSNHCYERPVYYQPVRYYRAPVYCAPVYTPPRRVVYERPYCPPPRRAYSTGRNIRIGGDYARYY